MKIASEQEMLDYGRRFAVNLHAPAVLELVGDVGAGKTTFTRGLAEGLGITDPISSPSYTISRRYALPTGGELIHYDFYRLSDPGIMAEDLKESLAGNNIVVIEWGENLGFDLDSTKIKITIEDEFSRNCVII